MTSERSFFRIGRMLRRMRAHTALGAVGLAAVVASMLAAPNLAGVLGGALAVVMITIAAIDARYFIIPDNLVLAALGLGLLHAVVAPSEGILAAVLNAVLRGLLLALAFWALLKGYEWLRGRAGMGMGDVKLALVAGVWLDWLAITIAIEIAAVAALAVLAVRAWRGHRVSRTTAVPFGAFFAPAIWLGWLLETNVLQALY